MKTSLLFYKYFLPNEQPDREQHGHKHIDDHILSHGRAERWYIFSVLKRVELRIIKPCKNQ